ncbi:sensor histidine kinase [Sphingoaurantiacus capsulatus]|uniref:histidine kinase n=1 Tax=Sphingoaurantiacus capsulatus TaxID=1771310 RepID=A0ABV7XAZ8_9SPHN
MMSIEEELRRALPHAEAWGETSRTLAFRRIAELLIRGQGTGDPELQVQAVAALERLRPQVPEAVRREALRLAAAHWPDRTMLWLFRHEPPAELLALAALVRLDEPEWQVLAAELPDEARRLLAVGRSRPESTPDAGYKPLAPLPPVELAALAGDWRWECDAQGTLVFVDGKAPLAVGDRLFDLDGADAIWAPFTRRSAFRGIDTGTCTLAGVPFFERGSGRFLGYRGTAQSVEATGLFGTGASSDGLAKVAHEVRSPLNAIMGFAQMIESETLGEAPEAYRRRAAAILDNAQRLLAALDDLTDAARLDRGHWSVDPAAVDVAALVERAAERHRALAASRGVSIAVTLAPSLPAAIADERTLDRAVRRLLAALIAVAESGETLLLGVQRAGGALRLFVTRPSALDDLPPDRLLDTATVAGDVSAAPLLGLGFGLRLVRQLGEAMGGTFAIEPQRFTLTLPGAEEGEQPVANGDQSA